MSDISQAISDFPWGVVNFLLIVGLAIVVWRKGWLGEKNEAAIKAKIAQAKQKITAWESQLTGKDKE